MCRLPALWVLSLGSTQTPCCWSCRFGPWNSACLSWRCCEVVSAACFPLYWGDNKRRAQNIWQSQEEKVYKKSKLTIKADTHEIFTESLFPDVVISILPGRHVVLGLSLAELANGAGHPFSVNIPAAHLPRPWPAVVSLWLLNQKGGSKDEPRGL